MAVPPKWSASVLVASALAAQRPQASLQVGPVGMAVERAVAAVQDGFWGAVLVAKDGKPVFAHGYGMLDRGPVAKGKEVTALSLFDLGGAVQELSQALAVRLAADKRLRLDDPVGKLLKDWPDDKAAMTVDQLLLHTSGMPADTRWDNGANEIARATLAAMAATPLASRPGERFASSDLNATLLALVLEARGGAAYDRLLEQKVLSPFGMATTTPCSSRGVDGKLVTWRFEQGAAKGEPASAQGNSWRNRGVRAVLASVHDVHAFLAHLCDGKSFDQKERDLLLRPLASGSLRRDLATIGGRSLARISGYATGYCTQWTVDPTARDWIVVMTSDDASATKVTTAVLLALGPGTATAPVVPTAPTAPPPDGQMPPSDPSGLPSQPRFVGEFALPSGGAFVVEARGQGLRLSGFGAEASVRVQHGRRDAAAVDAAARHEDRAVALLQRLLAGEVAALEDGFGAQGDAAAEAASAVLTGFLAERGPLVRCSFLGDLVVDGRVRSWLRLVGERGSMDLVATWRDDRRFERCERAPAGPPPFFVDLGLVAPDRAAGTTARDVPIVCTIEGAPAQRVLVFEDASPGAEGLLECPMARRPPR